MAIIRSFIRQPLSFILLLIVPVVLMFSFYQLMTLTIKEVEVKIVFVDEYDQEVVKEIVEELQIIEPFTIVLEEEIPWNLLERGEVEAVFKFADNFAEKIYEGQTDDLLTWYRHEQSIFDSLMKEQLAASIVNYVVRAEAANIVTRYDEQANWDEVYSYGLRYLGPEPIFQMNFEKFDGKINQDLKDPFDSLPYLRLATWLYSAIVMSIFARELINWRRDEIFKRLKLLRHATQRVNLTWVSFIILICTAISYLILNSVSYYVVEKFYPVQLFVNDFVVIVLTAFIILLLTKWFQRNESFIAFTLTYIVISVVIFVLIEMNLLTIEWWTYLFVTTFIFG